jgi:16S rRNA processing protein RimM
VLLRIREAKEHSDTIVATAEEVDDRSAAEALKGARIFVPRSSFPTARDDEYYWVDLIGLSWSTAKASPGHGARPDATGPQTVLVVGYEEDGKPSNAWCPSWRPTSTSVDLPGKRITVDWQPDY